MLTLHYETIESWDDKTSSKASFFSAYAALTIISSCAFLQSASDFSNMSCFPMRIGADSFPTFIIHDYDEWWNLTVGSLLSECQQRVVPDTNIYALPERWLLLPTTVLGSELTFVPAARSSSLLTLTTQCELSGSLLSLELSGPSHVSFSIVRSVRGHLISL